MLFFFIVKTTQFLHISIIFRHCMHGTMRAKGEMHMIVSITTRPNTLIAHLTGELDEHTAADARKKLDLAIHMACVQNFIFDFSGLTFMDSTGIGVLLGRYKALRAKHMRIYIANPSPHIDKILNMAGIYSIMQKINERGQNEQLF